MFFFSENPISRNLPEYSVRSRSCGDVFVAPSATAECTTEQVVPKQITGLAWIASASILNKNTTDYHGFHRFMRHFILHPWKSALIRGLCVSLSLTRKSR
jgi:hypothetical protein